MFCYSCKQPIARQVANTERVTKVPINDVLAANLRHYMERGELRTQAALAQRCGLAQRTIGNYLHPKLRQGGISGKAPSAKLSELEKICDALQIEVWQLLRPASAIEHALEDDLRYLVDKAMAQARDAAALQLHEPARPYSANEHPTPKHRKPPRAA